MQDSMHTALMKGPILNTEMSVKAEHMCAFAIHEQSGWMQVNVVLTQGDSPSPVCATIASTETRTATSI